MGVGAVADRLSGGAGAALRSGGRGAGPGSGGGGAASDRRGAAADRRRGSRAAALALYGDAGDARADARARRPPLRLPAEGGRPALLGDPAALAEAEGGADGGAGRRVWGRQRRTHAFRAVREDDGDAGTGSVLWRLPRRPAG